MKHGRQGAWFAARIVFAALLGFLGAMAASGQSYYSTQNPDWPPLPANVHGLPQAEISPGIFLLDDENVDYLQLWQEMVVLNALESAASLPPPPPGCCEEGSGGPGGGPNGLGWRMLPGNCSGRLLPPVYQFTNLVLSLTNVGGGESYDLFTAPSLVPASWTYLGRWTNTASSWIITNPPAFESYYYIACARDSDSDGLPDGYEAGVTHTDPQDQDSDYDGITDCDEHIRVVTNSCSGVVTNYYDFTAATNAAVVEPKRLAFFRFNDTNNYAGDRGQLPVTNHTYNLQSVDAWATKGVQLTNSTAELRYETMEKDDWTPNINLRSGTVRFWFKPLWTSGAASAPANGARLLEAGEPGTNGWWTLYFGAAGTNLLFVSQTNGAGAMTNLAAGVSLVSNNWYQVALTYTNGALVLYTNGLSVVSNGNSFAYPGLLVRSNGGFTLGSDHSGANVAKGVFEDLETFNYPLNAGDILENFQLAQPPYLIPNLRQWLTATVVHTNALDRIDVWPDQSGNTNHASTSTGDARPFFVTDAINGVPVVRFYPTNSFATNLSSFITNWTEAEAFVVLRVATNKPGTTRGLWRIGSGGNGAAYPDVNGEITDSFGSTTTAFNVGSTSQGLTNFHLYNPMSRSGEWAARLNGVLKYHSASNTVGFRTNATLGSGLNPFHGDVAELLLYNRALTANERLCVNRYLNTRFQLMMPPGPPTNLTANVLSPGQISLWWNASTNNEQTVYTLERSTDGLPFSAVAQVEGASFIDSGLLTNAAYCYRVKAGNLAGESVYTTSVTATTAANGVEMPLEANSLQLWLKADAGALVNYDGTLDSWLDVSGHTNVVAYPISSGGYNKRPSWISSVTNVNDHPVVRFYGTNWFELWFQESLTTWTNAEAYLVLKTRTSPPFGNPGHWRLGAAATLPFYPRGSDAAIVDSFASDRSFTKPNISQSLTNYHLYNVSSRTDEWASRLNTSTLISAGQNTVMFPAYTPTLGLGQNPFDGDMLELLIYNQALSSAQRSSVNEYFRLKYNLW